MSELWATILNPWVDVPIYHRLGPWDHGDFTRCGRKVGLHKPWLPMKHVVKFARPCKECFPE